MPTREQAVDVDRLEAMRGQAPTSASHWLPERHLRKWSSRRGDLVLWESLAPQQAYVPPFEGHVIAVARQCSPRSVTWLASQGLTKRAVATGEVTIVAAGEPMYVDVEEPHSAFLVSLQPRALYRCLEPGGDARERRLALRSVTGQLDPVIHALTASMIASVKEGPTCSGGDYLDGAASALAAHLLACYVARPERVIGRLGGRALAQLHEAMAARLHDPPGLDELAAQSGYSVYHFSHLFKAATGISPMRYLLRLRMERARERVETTPLSLGEIGVQVGFDSLAHFSRSFRAYWGVAPSQLRAER